VSERSWQVSLNGEQDPKNQILSALIGSVVDNNNETLAARLRNDIFALRSEFADENVELTLDEHAASVFYNRLIPDEKQQFIRVLDLGNDTSWRYGKKELTDGLWDSEVHIAEIPFERSDALVLSGAVGLELIGMSNRLDRLSKAIEPNLFCRTILIGGLAVTESRRNNVVNSTLYQTVLEGGLVAETKVGGTIHGDFWTSRQTRFQDSVIDPTGAAHVFGPAFETDSVPAYHSTETHILETLLAYQVLYQGVNPNKLYGSIVSKLDTVAIKGSGPFADFGQDDGYQAASSLFNQIEENVIPHEGEVLKSLLIYPGIPNTRMNMTARENGVEFSVTSEMEETVRSFVLPSNEIESYAITLFESGFGRTSQFSLLSVINGLVIKPDPKCFVW
jgi:hypothetical protein